MTIADVIKQRAEKSWAAFQVAFEKAHGTAFVDSPIEQRHSAWAIFEAGFDQGTATVIDAAKSGVKIE